MQEMGVNVSDLSILSSVSNNSHANSCFLTIDVSGIPLCCWNHWYGTGMSCFSQVFPIEGSHTVGKCSFISCCCRQVFSSIPDSSYYVALLVLAVIVVEWLVKAGRVLALSDKSVCLHLSCVPIVINPPKTNKQKHKQKKGVELHSIKPPVSWDLILQLAVATGKHSLTIQWKRGVTVRPWKWSLGVSCALEACCRFPSGS